MYGEEDTDKVTTKIRDFCIRHRDGIITGAAIATASIPFIVIALQRKRILDMKDLYEIGKATKKSIDRCGISMWVGVNENCSFDDVIRYIEGNRIHATNEDLNRLMKALLDNSVECSEE